LPARRKCGSSTILKPPRDTPLRRYCSKAKFEAFVEAVSTKAPRRSQSIIA
jgi:hypothetical protein